MSSAKIKILIVDDSVIIQKLLKNFLSKQADFEIVSICSDPFEASQYIAEHKVDCMVLDLEMPKMDGVTFLKKVKEASTIQTIIMSGLIESDTTLKQKLISIGAFDAFPKPKGDAKEFFNELCTSIRKAFKKTMSTERFIPTRASRVHDILLIASSTGGTDGVRKIVQSLGSNPPTVIIIQHMAALFTKKFAVSLNLVAKFDIEEINDHSPLKTGMGYVAPGNYHVGIHRKSDQSFTFELNQEAHIHAVRPAADYTFLNLPKSLMKKTTVIVLSGMGKDGAKGLLHLKNGGATTIAESEKSAVVFGMPKAAIETGGVDHVLTIDQICEYLSAEFDQNSQDVA